MNLAKTLSVFCVLAALCASSLNAQAVLNDGWFGNAGGLSIPPSGSGGGASSPNNTLSFHVDSSLAGLVSTDPAVGTGLGVYIDLSHSYCGDLIITLEHCGVSVELSDGNITNPWMNYAGSYTFRDDATVSINQAPNDGTQLINDSYLPTNSLDAFRGLPAGGRWTLTIYDRFSGDTGTLNSMGAFVHRDGVSDAANNLSLAIPSSGSGGATGGCSNPANLTTQTINLSSSSLVGEIGINFNLNHSNAQDLLITLSHNGVSRVIFDGAQQTVAGADFNGWYLIRENSGPITPGHVSNGVITGPWHGSLEGLSAFRGMPIDGNWTLTLCDRNGNETGTLNHFVMIAARSGLEIEASQPVSMGDITVNVKGAARAGNTYFKPFTLNPGNFPYGWFYGIDIDIPSLITLWNLSPSFPTVWGSFDNCVEDPVTLVGPIPAGITFYSVAMEWQSGLLRQLSKPVVVSTQ